MPGSAIGGNQVKRGSSHCGNIAKMPDLLRKVRGLVIAGKPERELSHLSTAASE